MTLRQLSGASSSAVIAPMTTPGAELRALYEQLRGTTTAWEMSLLETLVNPMATYPLPGIISKGHWGYNPATYNNGYTIEAPQYLPQFFGDSAYPDQSSLQQSDGAGGFSPVAAAQLDVYAGSRYDQREGLVRGTFSVPTSGQFVVWFDPTDTQHPVTVRAVQDMDKWWTDTTNVAPILDGGVTQAIFEWDRDPYRQYADAYRTLTDYGDVSSSQFVYVGGAVLHVAVQAKTAYSDVAIKARNIANYDRRFFDVPTSSGEYGDPTQPEKANEGVAVYNGTTWGPTFTLEHTAEKAVATRFGYVISRGFPMLEFHVVNATTGGAPVNFNFEARAWLGITYTTLRDAATTAYHTVPTEMPAWFSACKTRGAVTMHRSELGEALITNTMRTMSSHPVPAVIRAIAGKVSPKKADSNFFSKLLSGVGNAVGIDIKHPLPSIASLLTGKVLPALGKMLMA